jgi:hypothetical protein
MKIRPVRAEFYADGQADTTKLIVVSRNLAFLAELLAIRAETYNLR